jgi:hypothetical protein
VKADTLTQAHQDAIYTAQRQLETEYSALRTLAQLGTLDGFDARFCRAEIARLHALLVRLRAR